ncbi:MAG: MFS transporter [Bifidobacteriaceae bacterium]|jgi:MFS family permease|nr:MFS transporter [Bifidobacteriaceae bacterium]
MPRNVWILSGIGLAVAVGFGVVAPVLPVFAASFSVGEVAAAAVISAFALMRLVFAPAVGWLTDRWGHRAVLVAGVLIVAVSSLAVGFAQSYGQVVVLRGLGGVGSAMFSVASMTILLGSVAADRRGRASALYQGSFLVGAVAGPAIGGLFGAISLRAPFFFYSITLGAAAAVALRLEPIGPGPGTGPRRGAGPSGPGPGAAAEAGGGDVAAPGEGDLAASGEGGPAASWEGGLAASGENGGQVRPLRVVWRDRRYQAALLAALAQGWNTNGTRAALVPLFVAAFLAADDAQAALFAGIAMAVGALAQMAAVWPAGVVVDKLGRRGPMVVGALVAAAALAALPFSGSLATLAGLMAVYAVGAALIGTAPAALVGDAAGPGGTRAIALYSMAGDAGSVVGPLAAGFLAAEFSYVTACAAGAALLAASAAFSAVMRPPAGLGE